MGKRKESEESVDVETQPPPKKHKKHKHKKHKKKRSDIDGTPTIPTVKQPVSIPPERTTISLNSPAPAPSQKNGEIKTPPNQNNISPKTSSKKKKGKGRDSGTSSDEERWLDAIQSGKLEEVDDELKKIKPKDPKLMTARQRAMLERKGDAVPDPAAEQLLALPTGYREKVMTPEMIKKAALKSQKRKQLLDEKREKDKKRTMERLLRKQDNKSTKQSNKRVMRKSGATITYCNNQEGITLSLPPGIEFPLKPKTISIPFPEVVQCGVSGCSNPKKYSCSKTGVPLCSLLCYKTNLSLHSVIPAC